MDRETKKIIGGIQPDSDDAISSFSWVNEDRLVFTYAQQFFGSDQRSSMGELYAVNFDGSDPDMLAVREPEMLRCVVGYVGVYDLNIMYSTGDIPKSWGGAGYLERVIGREKAALDEFSPTTHAARIKATPMLIHGEDDIRAPIDHAYAMREALKDAGKDSVWLKIDDSGHGAGSLKNRLELYEGLLAFLDSNLM